MMSTLPHIQATLNPGHNTFENDPRYNTLSLVSRDLSVGRGSGVNLISP